MALGVILVTRFHVLGVRNHPPTPKMGKSSVTIVQKGGEDLTCSNQLEDVMNILPLPTVPLL